ncbi:hypothetical protein MYAM1_002467 [Malassezia yamatoensis]|uniref:protein-tyrosine-phosphatase n=1 Tax=Malassezia yamatoensis TaxID=253288 RepID=A0AAJ5YTY6_9BASI|nr:hypothetical protein MYAM1_002467 [Malassezia yamatoensis]
MVTIVTEATATYAPDDSDLQDNVNDLVSGRDQVAVQHSNQTASSSSSSSQQPQIVHGLIPVSNRFWFAVLSVNAFPEAGLLNQKDGMRFATFPKDLPLSARPEEMHWFCIDEDLVYLSFSNDWGPLNIAMFYRFCVHVHQMLLEDDLAGKHLCLYTSSHAHSKANAALLCALYAMTIDHVSPAEALYPYTELELKPFRDAGYGRADFSLTMQDILYGMRRALDHQLLDLTTFDLEEYEHYEQVQNGDWNWITPHFLAFASPKDKAYMAMLAASGGQTCALPHTTAAPPVGLRNTIDYFAKRHVGLVVRLNNPLYDRKAFVSKGIAHKDLYFDDGSNPSDDIVHTFINDADRTIAQGRVIAVHCKAGLGRTGVLIGAYLIWKYQFTANEAIGYMRIMRPGCVVGPQQHYMYQRAATWMQWGVEHRLRTELRKELQDPVPRTPSVKRTQIAIATPHASPESKPTPCVGQPRKSPSPKRRRVGLLGSSSTENTDSSASFGSVGDGSNSAVNSFTEASTESDHSSDHSQGPAESTRLTSKHVGSTLQSESLTKMARSSDSEHVANSVKSSAKSHGTLYTHSATSRPGNKQAQAAPLVSTTKTRVQAENLRAESEERDTKIVEALTSPPQTQHSATIRSADSRAKKEESVPLRGVERCQSNRTDEEVLGVLPHRSTPARTAAENAKRMASPTVSSSPQRTSPKSTVRRVVAVTPTPAANSSSLSGSRPRQPGTSISTSASGLSRISSPVTAATGVPRRLPTSSASPSKSRNLAPRERENVPPAPRTRFVARPRP